MSAAGVWLLALVMQSSSSTGAVDLHVRAVVTADALPRHDASELRPEIGAEITAKPSARLTMRFDGVVDGLLANRDGRVDGASVLVRDAYVETHAGAVDVRAGYGRLVWGRLDEVAPTDVINPLDAARFLFDGRSEARLPVTFVRARVSASERLRLEGVVVPRFRRGVFDRIEESSSPFNLAAADAVVPAGVRLAPNRIQVEPANTWQNLSGGLRVEATVGRVDASASVYRGFDGLGPIGLQVSVDPASGQLAGQLVEFHPRFTMIGGDVETVAGAWALRGEVAGFVERSLLSAVVTPELSSRLVPGRSFDAGVGVDRRIGDWRVFGSTVLHREWAEQDPAIARTDVNLVGSIERSFRGDRYRSRAFAVVNPADASAFLRGVWTWKVRDDVTVDASAGIFLGTGTDAIGRFATRDFVLTRARYDF